MSADEMPVDQTPIRRHGAEHLEPYWFKKGQSGNPAGRPKHKSLEVVLRELMERKWDEGEQTTLEVFAETVVKMAIETKDMAAIKVIMDRLYPAPKYLEVTAQYNDPMPDAIDVRPVVDVSRLDEEDQASLREMARKAISRGDDQDAA